MPEDEDLSEKIVTWLSTQGYPLEMRVAQQLSRAGQSVIQSDFYADFETGTNREIDVVSRLYKWYEPPLEVRIAELLIYSMIECKSNQKPWIVFKGSKADLWALDAPMRNKAAQKLLVASDRVIETGFLYNVANSAANGITQAFTSGKDVPYQALIGAFKASEAKIKLELEAEIERKQDEEQKENSHPTCVFPIVMTDARLFECSLADNGQTTVNEVEYAAVGFRYPRQATRGKYFGKGAVVYIFRESAINLLISGLIEFEEALAEKLPILLE